MYWSNIDSSQMNNIYASTVELDRNHTLLVAIVTVDYFSINICQV